MDIRSFFHDCLLVIFLLNIHCGEVRMQDEDYDEAPSFGRCPWIRNKLKNGRVRYRYKGRVAKFLCDSGYELAGKRSSTCVRGQWSNPIPVCVARGCPRVSSIANGHVTEMYRGALLVYDCNPGYTLAGDSSIHCDGRRWNSTSPVCIVSNPNPETQCDFERLDLCGWIHDPIHDFDWKRNQFATPSGHVGTGPSHDHTFGENKAGYYLFIEASSPRKLNDTARLFSPVYPAEESGGCFFFWYHMYGATTGGIRVFLKPESYVFGELFPSWKKFGDQGNQWHKGNISVPILSENFQIIIEGIRGESYVGDSAIDDVQLTKNDCESMENATEGTEGTVAESCRGRCGEVNSNLTCGCNENCHVAENCCRDYFTLCSEGNDTSVQNTEETSPGDFYGKPTIPVTVGLVTSTSFKTTKEESSTSDLNVLSLSTIQTSTASSSISSTPVTRTFSTVAPSLVPSPTTPTIISSTEATTSTSVATTFLTISSTAKIEPQVLTISTSRTKSDITTEPMLITNSTPKPRTETPKPSTTIKTTTPKTTTKNAVEVTTPDSAKLSSSTKPTIKATTSTISTITITNLPKTTKALVLTTTADTGPATRPVSTSMPTKPSTQSTTVPSTTQKIVSDVQSSPSSNSTIPETTSMPPSSTTSTVSTPRYNLRPRTSTTKLFTQPYITSTTLNYRTSGSTNSTTVSSSTNTKFKEEISPVSQMIGTTSQTKRWFDSITFSTSTARSTVSSTKTKFPPVTSTMVRYRTQASTDSVTKTTKFAIRIPKTTPSTFTSTVFSTSNPHEMGASKAESTKGSDSSPVVISVVVIIILCIAFAIAYYYKKHRGKIQSKLDDDSEMRFLPESDYMEYSDASALDKILIK